MDACSDSNSQSSPAGAFNSEESASQPQAHRQKTDIAWGYVSEGRNAQGRKTMICTQCFKVFSGGGIHRMKQHLAGVSGNVSSCPKVDPAIRIAMLASLQENEKKSKERRGDFEVENPFGRAIDEFDGDEVQEIPSPRVKGISINEAGASSGKGKRKATAPTENWWKLFGCDAPNLQKLAIRVLSQTASSSGCERNWSVFEWIHTKKRNRLEHQRLNDLVYVHYNLRLQYRHDKQKRSYDPVDYESIDKTEFWVVEEEQEGELDYDDLEEELEELPVHNECSNFEQLEDNEDGAEDVDLETFQRRNFFVDDEDDDWH